jgi:hypothetical protein
MADLAAGPRKLGMTIKMAYDPFFSAKRFEKEFFSTLGLRRYLSDLPRR